MNDDLSVRWTLANPLTIQKDDTGEAWNAGTARDVVALDFYRVLVATDTGGIWIANRDGGAVPIADVDSPDFWCIAAGIYGKDLSAGEPGNDHFYAGGAKLYETDISKPLALFNWREIPVTWVETGRSGPFTSAPHAIYRIAVLREDRRIVLATTNGVVWADIPPAPQRPRGCLLFGAPAGPSTPPGIYTWKKAKGLDDGMLGYLGLAVGPPNRGELERTVAVASWGYEDTNASTLEPLQFYHGAWESGELVFSKARMDAVSGIDHATARATTMASCQAEPTRMYAISSDDAGFPAMFWKSIDAGRTWTPSTPLLVDPKDRTFADAAGNQGNSWARPCNCIAAARHRADRVAVGWRVGGFFVSEDAGATWRRTDTESSPHTHADVHAIYFDPTDWYGQRLFIAHDGGVSMAPVLGHNAELFESRYNRQLATLQFQTAPSRMFFGGAGVSPAQSGALIGGLQDNGVLTCSITPTIEPWREVEGGDGYQTTFLSNGHALFNNNDETSPPHIGIVRHGFWNTAPPGLVQKEYVRVLKDDPQMPYPAGLPEAPGATVAFSAVRAPGWTNRDGERMYAVAAKRSSIYGLFYSAGPTRRPHWEFIARFSLNERPSPQDIKDSNWERWAIAAVASWDGGTIYVGTIGGRLIVFEQTTRVAREIGVPLRSDPWGDVKAAVHKIVVVRNQLAFALYNVGRTRFPGAPHSRFATGYVLRIRPPQSEVLTVLPVEAYYGLEAGNEEQVTLYAATDSDVYVSRDAGDALGETWERASSGLPKRAHCGDLSFVVQPDGKRWLYLSSYGRSFWRARR